MAGLLAGMMALVGATAVCEAFLTMPLPKKGDENASCCACMAKSVAKP